MGNAYLHNGCPPPRVVPRRRSSPILFISPSHVPDHLARAIKRCPVHPLLCSFSFSNSFSRRFSRLFYTFAFLYLGPSVTFHPLSSPYIHLPYKTCRFAIVAVTVSTSLFNLRAPSLADAAMPRRFSFLLSVSL